MNGLQPDNETQSFRPRAGRMKAGAALVAIGGLIGAVGSLLSSLELVMSTRRWLKGQGVPPADLLRDRTRKVVVAGQAGTRAAAEAWSHNGAGERATQTGR